MSVAFIVQALQGWGQTTGMPVSSIVFLSVVDVSGP